jgi:hypothetical protein
VCGTGIVILPSIQENPGDACHFVGQRDHRLVDMTAFQQLFHPRVAAGPTGPQDGKQTEEIIPEKLVTSHNSKAYIARIQKSGRSL